MSDPIAEALKRASSIGREHGGNAAEWYIQETVGGRVQAEQAKQNAALLLKGLADGDPLVFDAIPTADLSGQYAAEYSAVDLARDVGMDADLGEVCTAYEASFAVAAQEAIERAAHDTLYRTVLLHLNVSVPVEDDRSPDEVAAAVMAAVEVGSDDFALAGLTVTLTLSEEP